jgi:hypothetical protein
MAALPADSLHELLDHLPKPIAANEQRLLHLADPCVTIKLDGIRALLVHDVKGITAHTLSGTMHVSDQGCSAVSIFDTELIKDFFYVFDALFVRGVDVRHLPLASRLERAASATPRCAVIKRFFWGPDPPITTTIQRLALSRPRLADGSRLESLEGFIIGSMAAPYQTPSIKFKFSITCDFLVAEQPSQSSLETMREFRLHVLRSQDLVPFRNSRDVPGTLLLTAERATELELPAFVEASDSIILRRHTCKAQVTSVT